MMKKIALLLIVMFSIISVQPEASAKKREVRTVPASQKLKVRVISFQGGLLHSEGKLERVLLEELNLGWVNDYTVNINNNGVPATMFVFKRMPKKK